jgi:hypothetical protein
MVIPSEAGKRSLMFIIHDCTGFRVKPGVTTLNIFTCRKNKCSSTDHFLPEVIPGVFQIPDVDSYFQQLYGFPLTVMTISLTLPKTQASIVFLLGVSDIFPLPQN